MAYKRTFRKHLLVGLIVPSAPWLAALALIAGGGILLLVNPFMTFLLALPTLLPVYKLLRVFFNWYDTSVTAQVGEHYLVMRRGRIGVQEQRVPLSSSFPATYNRPRWAALLHLDLADVTIAAIGGPYIMRHMGEFADFWTAITSLGEEVPEKEPHGLYVNLTQLTQLNRGLAVLLYQITSVLASLEPHFQRLVRGAFENLVAYKRHVPTHYVPETARSDESALSRTLTADSQRSANHPTDWRVPVWPPAEPASVKTQVPDGGYFYKGTSFSAHTPSHAGLMAFCKCFVLAGNWSFWNYRHSDPKRPYYPDGISESVAAVYLACLRQNMILIPVSNGHGAERLSARAGSIQDIESIILGPTRTDSRADSEPANKVA